MPLFQRPCSHIPALPPVAAAVHVCQQCLDRGDTWVHLRVCQTCGAVNCCDASPNRHATAHFHETNHPVVASAEPGQHWVYCYADEVFLPRFPAK
jgi:uncharacterized UBP type Zn finger protein